MIQSTTFTPTYTLPFTRTDRPCLGCSKPTEYGDRYCMHCGHQVYSLADALLAWKPNVNERRHEPLSGAPLAKQVRTLLKPFKAAGLAVRTDRGYTVNVAFPVPNFWVLAFGNQPQSLHNAPYHIRWHQEHWSAAEAHLKSTLRFLFPGTSGIRDDGPGADYPYQSLPILNVNGW